MNDDVAVFPLPLVVFPGMTVPLHVFEERYKALVKYTEALDAPRFAVAQPATIGLEDEGVAKPGEVGTIVDVIEMQENVDGTYTIVGHGVERCRLAYTRVQDVPERDGTVRPLWFATVHDWPLERGDPNEERIAAWDALEAFDRYGTVFFAPQAREQARSALPEDPLYQASFVCANLRLPAENAQRLLEAPSLVDRFTRARDAIDQRIAAHASGEPLQYGSDA